MSDITALESTNTTLPPSPQLTHNSSLPPLSDILSAHDFALAASKALTPQAWAFYSSAATDQLTLQRNRDLVRRIMLRPRILRDVSAVDTTTSILGFESRAPFFMCPAAMATLAHEEGEKGWSRAAANEGILQIISSNASFPLPEIIKAAPRDYPFFLQLYVNADRAKTRALLRQARALGVRAVFVTVDAPVPGKREADERATSGAGAGGSGMGRLVGRYIDRALTWADLAWIREASSVPVVLKGVQTAEDVRLAVEAGVEGVVLSNHGGRSLDGAQASILVLLEVRKRFPEAFRHLEIYIDGGFERGSDILKAIALGATAVGIARPFLYSLVYGQEGVEHLSKILKDELETSMRLAGITSLDQATPALVNTLDVDYLVSSQDSSYEHVPRRGPVSKL